jgi:hypothetical protein
MFEDIQTPAYVLHVFIDTKWVWSPGILWIPSWLVLNTMQPATEAVTRKTLVVQFELICDNMYVYIYIVYQSWFASM